MESLFLYKLILYIRTEQLKKEKMKTEKKLATLLKESQEANKNFVKMLKRGNDKMAYEWAKKVEELEEQIENLY